jgi:hypothetical protein
MGFFKKFQCDICSTKFSKQEQLMLHQQVVQEFFKYGRHENSFAKRTQLQKR